MPDIVITRRPDRPTAGFTTARLQAHPDRPVRLFVPADYQSKYAYPLVVMFHGNGADEDAAARLAPQLSHRNYIAACPRGPVALGSSASGRPEFAWNTSDSRLARYIHGVLNHADREYHIHPERVYLFGVGEGATVAYRLGLVLRDRVAGVVALNGVLPACRVKTARGLRVFVGHGSSNPVVSVAAARKASRVLAAAGAEVRFQAYPTTHRVHSNMLRDVNRWLIESVNPNTDAFPNPNG